MSHCSGVSVSDQNREDTDHFEWHFQSSRIKQERNRCLNEIDGHGDVLRMCREEGDV